MTNVYELLIETEKKFGDRIALSDGTDSLTYSELLHRSGKLASVINCKIKSTRQPIAVITDRNIDSVVAFWAVAASGNFYIAIDSKMPDDRFCKVVEQINPALFIFAAHNDFSIPKDKIVSVSDIDTTSDELDRRGVLFNTLDVDPLYMVLTSGSTGTPKAIVKSHRSVMEFVDAFLDTFELDENEVFGNQASFDFDVSAKDIFISVASGGTLCIIPHKCFMSPGKLTEFLNVNRVTTAIWSASAVKLIYKVGFFNKKSPEYLTNLFFSGEVMPGVVIEYWRNHLPNATFVNLYAPSEVTGNCLYHIIEEEDLRGGIIPLSDSFNNSEVLIINDDFVEASDGEKGEIYVRGAFLALGYYNNQSKTMESFIQNPLHNRFIDLVYKTGDYVVRKNGKLYFAGRVDNQVKHMGYRIELEEIEKAIYELFDVDRVCVLYDESNSIIVVVMESDGFSYDELVEKLKNTLPKYMIPHRMVSFDRIPTNERGKIDRKETFRQYKENLNEG